MGLTALGLIAAREGEGDPRGRIALVTSSFGAGQILGPAFAGYVYDHTGSLAVPSLAAAAALVVAGLLALAGGRAPSCPRGPRAGPRHRRPQACRRRSPRPQTGCGHGAARPARRAPPPIQPTRRRANRGPWSTGSRARRRRRRAAPCRRR